jgi:hypothetical protein
MTGTHRMCSSVLAHTAVNLRVASVFVDWGEFYVSWSTWRHLVVYGWRFGDVEPHTMDNIEYCDCGWLFGT